MKKRGDPLQAGSPKPIQSDVRGQGAAASLLSGPAAMARGNAMRQQSRGVGALERMDGGEAPPPQPSELLPYQKHSHKQERERKKKNNKKTTLHERGTGTQRGGEMAYSRAVSEFLVFGCFLSFFNFSFLLCYASTSLGKSSLQPLLTAAGCWSERGAASPSPKQTFSKPDRSCRHHPPDSSLPQLIFFYPSERQALLK